MARRSLGRSRAGDVSGTADLRPDDHGMIISSGFKVICPWINRSARVAALESPSVTHESHAWRRHGGSVEEQVGQKLPNLIIT